MPLLIFLLTSLIDPASAIETIVVTATRLPQTESSTSSATTVLQASANPAENSLHMVDSLQALPGLQLRTSGGPGQSRSLFIRGASAEHALVLLDGIPLNDPLSPNRSYDFAHLSTSGLGQIEIIRGPQSGVYGSDAMSGVVQVFTPEPQPGPAHMKLGLEAGSFGTRSYQAQAEQKTKDGFFSASAYHAESLGISAAGEKYGNKEADGFDNAKASLQVARNFGEHASAKLTTHFMQSHTQLDNGGGQDQDTANNNGHERTFLGRAELTKWWADDNVKSQIAISTNRGDRHYLNPNSNYHSVLYKADWANHWSFAEKQTISLGADWQEEKGDSSEIVQPKSDYLIGAFTQYTGDSSLFFGSANLRADRYTRFGTQSSVRAAPGIHVFSGTDLIGSYGTGFKAPSLFQTYSSSGSLSLRPEKTHAWDIGIRQSIGDKNKIELQYFEQKFQDLITSVTLATVPTTYSYANIKSAKTSGAEASITAAWSERFSNQLSATRLFTRDESTRLRLARRPGFAGTLLSTWTPQKNLVFALKQSYVGSRDDSDPSSFVRKRMPSYILWDLGGHWRLQPTWGLHLRLENIFANDYEDVAGYGTAGRSVYAGITAQL